MLAAGNLLGVHLSAGTISAWFRALNIFSSMGKLQLQPDDISRTAVDPGTKLVEVNGDATEQMVY